MSTEYRTPNEVRRLGLRALIEALGPIDAARFMQQFASGGGDYTAERHRWLEPFDVDDILQLAEARRTEREEHC